MKSAISTALLLILLGTTSAAFARQDKDQHSQGAKPEERQQAKPAPQQHSQAKPAQHQQAQSAKPAPQRTQQAARPQQQSHPVAKAQQNDSRPVQASARQSQPATRNNGGYAHGRISNAHYTANFGSGHSFHVNRGEFDNRRFSYGGYSFGFVDPWPVAWGYSDDVYVVYADGGYYMYDRVHPGLRISINIL